MGTRQRGRVLVAMALVMTMALVGARGVSAHAQLKTSVPADKAIVGASPTQVVLTFSEETSATKSGGAVTDASGATVSTGFKVDLNERTRMTIDLKPNLPNGVYTVRWNTLTEDDNGTANGTFTFTVQAAATGTGTPPSGTATTGSAVAGTTTSGSAVTAATSTSVPPTATAAPTATRAATTVVATGSGGGTVTTGAIAPPATLPTTGNASGGTRAPWALVLAALAAIIVAGGVALRHRAARP